MSTPTKLLAVTAILAGVLSCFSGCASSRALSTPTVANVVRTIEFRGIEIPLVSNARYQMTAAPAFPSVARQQEIKGTGVIRVVVDQSGEPIDYAILDSRPLPEFGQALVDVARHWQYPQMTAPDGRPIIYATEISVNFRPAPRDLPPPLVIGTPESSGSYEGTRR